MSDGTAASDRNPAVAFGEVYDRGFQHYEGARLGRKHAFRALTTYSMKRALGSKKSWTAKVVPVLLYVAVALVVVIPLGIRSFFADAEVVEYWDYFGIIFVILGVFVATIAPEMLCNDRKENVLTIYFSRAITRPDYLLAKLLATAMLTLTVTLLPMGIYWLGRQLLGDSPISAMRDNIGELWRIIIMSVLTALYLGAIGLAVSSFTGRKAVAVAVIVVGFIVVSSLAGAMTQVINDEAILPYLTFISPAQLIAELSNGIFGQDVPGNEYGEPLSVWSYAGGMIVSVLISCGVMYWRYVPSD
ncbi:hypothetical protein BH23CHL5_BH23CHL5_18490 [soil metagenome]